MAREHTWRDYARLGRRRVETTIAVLDKLSRARALTLHESRQLESAIKAERYSERSWLYWRQEEDEKAQELRAQGLSYGKIALEIKRTPDAVAARLRALRIGLRGEG